MWDSWSWERIESIQELWESVLHIDDVVLPQWDYDRWHDSFYAGATLVLETVPDPGKKVMMIFWIWKTPEAYEKIQGLNKDRKGREKKEDEEISMSKCAVETDKKNTKYSWWDTIWLSTNRWYAIWSMSYSEMMSCSSSIWVSARGSLFEKWLRKDKNEYSVMQRYDYLNEVWKKRIADGITEAWSYWKLNNVLIEMKNYKATSKINKTQLQDYLTHCNNVNREITLWLRDETEMWLRYIFSRKEAAEGNMSVFENSEVDWFNSEKIEYEECKTREIYYYNGSGILTKY